MKTLGTTFSNRYGLAALAGVLAVGLAACDSRGGRDGFGGNGIDGPGDGSGNSVDGDVDDDDDADDDDDPAASEPEPELPFDPDQLYEVCARNNGDRVAAALCGGSIVKSLGDLRQVLAFEDPFFAMTANSSSLVARSVTSINPRLIVADSNFKAEGAQARLQRTMALGFTRGEQLVELMAYDPKSDELNFYLLKFEQACNDSPEGCLAADLVTPDIEQDWTRWTLYQDIDLVNTTVDCMVCHQPLGVGTPKVPRLQEVNNSWTHWFPVRPPTPPQTFPTGGGGGPWSSGDTQTAGDPVDNTEQHGTRSSEILFDQFERMHAAEGVYGGVPIEQMRDAAAGPDMETFVRTFLETRELPLALRPPQDPDANLVSDYFCDSPSMEELGAQSQWATEYERVVTGQRLPLPSHRIDITDELAREAAIDSYHDLLEGWATPVTLLDPREVVSDEVLTEMSILPRQDASAEEILTHMCSRCHNGSMDQSLTRARFDATKLQAVTAAEKNVIISRLQMHEDDRRLMPPKRFATLPDWALERVLEWAQQ